MAKRETMVSRVRAVVGGLLLLLGAIWAPGTLASAAPGELDTSFGDNGFATFNLNDDARFDYGNVVLVDGLGRVVVVGECDAMTGWEVCVLRFTADGLLDTSFGTGGVVVSDISGDDDLPSSAAFDSAGNIVVVGSCTNVTSEICIARYTPAGVLDSAFGGDGTVELNVSGDFSPEYGRGVAIDSSDNVVLVGSCSIAEPNFCVVRYTTAGVLDGTFGGDGIVSTDIGADTFGDGATAVVIDSLDRIVVVGTCTAEWRGPREQCVARFTGTGLLDASFAGDGWHRVDVGANGQHDLMTAAALDSGERIVAAGSCVFGTNKYEACVVRYTPDGVLDTSFSGDGIATSQGSVYVGNVHIKSATVDSNDRVVVGGDCRAGVTTGFCVMRFAQDGSLDPTFGGDGIVTAVHTGEYGDYARGVAVDAQDRVLATGYCADGVWREICVARFNQNSLSLPSAPVGIVATPGDGEIAVSWSPPISDGGSPITSYTVSTLGSESCVTTTTSCVFVGLTNGRPYQVFVSATTAVGIGPTGTVPQVTPVGKPAAPIAVTAVSGDSQAIVSWVYGAWGGTAPTSATVTASPGGASCTVSDWQTSSCVITGLTNWLNHTFTVVVSNAVGDSPASAPSAPVMPGLSPDAPSSVSYSTDGQLTWTVPTGETPLTGHVVEYREMEAPSSWLSPMIVGGTFSDISNHRYGAKVIAFEGSQPLYECGGVFIAPQWMLTAAHCTEYQLTSGFYEPDYVAVVYGLSDWTTWVNESKESHVVYGSAFYRHPGYHSSSSANDIALVRLDTPIDPAASDVVPLYDIDGPSHLAEGFVTGWGAISTDGPVSDTLKGTEVTVDGSCGQWPGLIPDWDDQLYLCATGFPSGACSGDSGGPLVVNASGVVSLAGIVSFSSAAGCVDDPTVPDVYTRVSNFVDWIEGYTGRLWQSTTVSTASHQPSISPSWAEPGKSYAVRIHAKNGVGAGSAIFGSFIVPADPSSGGAPGGEIPGGGTLGPGVDCTVAQPHPFVDIPQSSYAYSAAGCIFSLGVTTGTSATTYSPSNPVTREQMAAFIARFYETIAGEACTGTHPFIDIAPSSYAFESVGCIYKLGITTGTSALTYSPHERVTREQMAAFLARLYRLVTKANCAALPIFVDVAPTSFALRDVGCIYDLGVTTGTSSTTYSPLGEVTREQMAAFLARLYVAITG